MKKKALTEEEKYVIIHKGTEAPFSGKYNKHHEKGFYLCKQCETALYESHDKFDSSCGWPSFDSAIENRVRHVPDADGVRTEIVCATCNAHLGHVFFGEQFTRKNTRHCVNSISLDFLPFQNTEEAIFAAGCFWGVEYYFKKFNGVLTATSGYTGGETENPDYKQVCSGKTGHAEAVKVVFNKLKTNYASLVRYFFEIHDFEQVDRQGPDIGTQYRSAIFYKGEDQKKMADEIIDSLFAKGYMVATILEKATKFWIAEDYHQDYYDLKGTHPYCHSYKKVF